MNDTVRLGTLLGIRVGVHWSVLVIATLLLVALSAGQLPQLYPGYSGAAYVIAGLIAAAVFFASLLAHEMAHAIVARTHGVAVEGITLWLFGGVAKLLGEASDPKADVKIAAVGPLVSLGLGATFGVLAVLGGSVGIERLVVGVLGWLAAINVMLALFNLIPAAPLDGGRILRGYLWRKSGDRHRAATTAARAGRSFGFMLIVAGLVSVLALPGIGGLWLAFIGWFISSAASAEEQHANLQQTLNDVRVTDVMTSDPVTAPAGISVAELLDDYVLRARCSTFPIVDRDGVLTGLVTLNRIRPVPADRRARVSIDDVACPLSDVVQANPRDRLLDLLPVLTRSEDRRAVVVDGEHVVGIVSPVDIARMVDLLAVMPASHA